MRNDDAQRAEPVDDLDAAYARLYAADRRFGTGRTQISLEIDRGEFRVARGRGGSYRSAARSSHIAAVVDLAVMLERECARTERDSAASDAAFAAEQLRRTA